MTYLTSEFKGTSVKKETLSAFLNMRLKYIAMAALLFVFLLLVGVYLFVSHLMIYPSFSEIEDTLARENMDRCRNTIERELYHLGLFNQDWAMWDDTYQFIEDVNLDYITSNLVNESFVTNNIHLMYFVNNQKQLQWHHISSEQLGFSRQQLQSVHELLAGLVDRFFADKENLRVLVKTSSFPLLLTSQGIYDSEKTKPCRGRLIMGRFLDDATVAQLVEQTQVNFEILPLSRTMAPSTITGDNLYTIKKVSPSTLVISSVYPDLNGDPAYQIRATLRREITSAGKEVIACFLIMIISTSIVLFAILLYFLNKCIIHPIFSLTEQIRHLRKSKQLDQPVRISRGYETQILAAEFNRLMRRLEVDRKKRMKIEEKLIESVEEAKRANEAKTTFLANMSHEIRTPMNSILGFSDLLRTEDLSDIEKEYVDTIYQSGNALLSLINDILDMSKIESGNMMIEKIPCSLTEMTDNLRHFIYPLAAQKSLDFKIIKNDAVPDRLVTDPLRLRQCLINLLSNAIKFTENGHVNLRIDPVASDPDMICFEVQDTGIGISPEGQKKIFDPFTQADAGTTRKYGGTGLGLSITLKLIDLLGGTLTLDSVLGQGTTFTMTLPINQTAQTQPETAAGHC